MIDFLKVLRFSFPVPVVGLSASFRSLAVFLIIVYTIRSSIYKTICGSFFIKYHYLCGLQCLRTAFKMYKNIIYLPSLIHSARRKPKTRIPQRKSKNKTSTSVRRLSLKRNSTNQKSNSKIEIVFLLACFGFLIQSNKFSKRTIIQKTTYLQ